MPYFPPPTRGANQPTPVLANGPEQFDDLKVGPCAVVKCGEGDYRMLYEGIDSSLDPDGAGANFYNAACYAVSADGVAWMKRGRVLTPDAAGWENSELCPTSLVWDGTQWVLFYHGGNNSPANNRRIGRATSPDLVDGGTWTKYGSNPILSPGTSGQWDDGWVSDAEVLFVGPGDWRMWYVGRDDAAADRGQIGYATSTDGISWSKSGSNPVLPWGTGGAWDDYDVQGVSVEQFSEAEWHMWFVAQDQSGGTTQLGQAWSTDGIAWTRSPFNPEVGDAADDDLSDTVESLLDGNRMRLYYGQYDLVGQTLRGKGYAFADAVAFPDGVQVDDFNRADDASPPPGTNWTNGVQTFTGGEGLAIVSNQVCRGASGGYRQGGWYNVRRFGSDVIAEVSSVPDTNFDGINIFGRLREVAAGTVDGYELTIERESATVYRWDLLRLLDGGVTTIAQNTTYKPTLVAGDLIALTMRASMIAGWWKSGSGLWRRMVTVTNTDVPEAGYVGLEFVGNQSAKITTLWASEPQIELVEPRSFPFAPVRDWRT